MKKTYNKMKALTAAFGLLALGASAQLSGVVTINSANATGGANYQTFTAFAAALNTQGVSGPLTVNVTNGPYNEQVLFNQIAGASIANKITINGNNCLITYNSTNSAAPWTIGMNGADYFTFNNLNFEGLGTTYAFPTILYSNANYNTYNNCTFSVNMTSTGTGVIPFVISGSGTTYASNGNSASFTSINSCTTSGGYYGITLYGNSTGASAGSNNFSDGNRIENSLIRDFYAYGIYSYYYTKNTAIRYNIIECPNRTNTTTKAGIYSYYNQGLLLEGNWIRNLFNTSTTGTSGTAYGVYCSYNLDSYSYGYSYPSRYPNIIRNNVISDFNFNGVQYGVYFYYADGQVYNNTISLDYTGTTSSTTYGIYSYGSTQYPSDVSNNIITITRGGSGTKYGYYNAAGANAGATGDRNDIYVNAPSGTNYTGYYSTTAVTQANLASQGFNVNGSGLNPTYVTLGTDYHPTNVAIDNMASVKGLIFDQLYAVRNPTAPDVGALEFLNPLCTGAPAIGAISGPTYALCPGENAAMAVGNLIPNSGISYTWLYSSVSNVGPFTTTLAAASPTNLFYTANNVTTPGWFQVIANCSNPGGLPTSVVHPILIAGPTLNTVPYLEDFEGIGMANRLPNCSWAATSLGDLNKTYISAGSGNRLPLSGTSFASFDNATPGTSGFYTSPIVMNAGITYSAAVNYATEYFGYSNWTNLSILVGPNQNQTGMVQVASIGPAISGPYKVLGNTFTVPSSGNYYVCVRATSASGSAQYLSFDDLSVTIPCDAASPNTPTISLSASALTICAGTTVNISASGGNTYNWSTGSNAPAISDAPTSNTVYAVTGMSGLSGCGKTETISIQVDASPNVFAVANIPVSCAGQPVILSAYGADSYAWSNGGQGGNITVSPLVNTSYTVIGISNGPSGCSNQFVQNVVVNTLPLVTVSSDRPDACKDDQITLSAGGAGTYVWYSSSSPNVYQGNPVVITAGASAIFTVMGTNANGCVGKQTVTQNVNDCTGIREFSSSANAAHIYPNPTTGEFTVEFNSNTIKTVSITDVTGRVIYTSTANDAVFNMNVTNLANGIYYVKVQSEDAISVMKIVKQ